MFQTLHEISKNLIFVFVWKYVWKYVNINVSDIKKKKNLKKKNKVSHWPTLLHFDMAQSLPVHLKIATVTILGKTRIFILECGIGISLESKDFAVVTSYHFLISQYVLYVLNIYFLKIRYYTC